jgi:hypothetical protein
VKKSSPIAAAVAVALASSLPSCSRPEAEVASSSLASSLGASGTGFVQVESTSPQSSAESVTASFSSSQTAGDLNVVTIAWNDATSAIESVTDSRGNVYKAAPGAAATSTTAPASIALYYAANIAAGKNSVTVKFDRAAPYPEVIVAEYSGIATDPFDVGTAASGVSTESESGTLHTSAANELIVGVNYIQHTTVAPGAGFVERTLTVDKNILEDETASAAGAYQVTASLTETSWWVSGAAAFRRSSGTTPSSATFPLRLAPGKRYVVDQSGKPFVILGDSGWEIVTTLDTASATEYLADRVKKGFNSIPIELIDNIYTASPTGANAYGELPFTKDQAGAAYTDARTQSPDFATPNPAYWAHADELLSLISSYGFLILLYPEWLGNPIGDPMQEGYYNALVASSSEVRQGYGAFVAGRYGPSGTNYLPNVVWVLGGDNNPANRETVTDLAVGIQSLDTVHLMSADTIDGTSPMDYWSGESWLSLDNVYTDELLGHPYVYQKSRTEYQRSDWKPMFLKESAYEGEHSSTPPFVRSESWQAVLGGNFGYFFGNNPIWLFADGWQAALQSRGSLDSEVLNRFIAARAWDLLVPDWSNTFLTNGGSYENADFVSASRASDGSWGAIYVQGAQPLTIDLSGFSHPVTVSWVDPTTGTLTALAGSPMEKKGTLDVTRTMKNATGASDWVLVFE